MQIALEQLDTIGQVDVQRFPNGYGFDWLVTFVSPLGSQPLLSVDDSKLAGPFAQAEAVTQSPGQFPADYRATFVPGGKVTSFVIPQLTLGKNYQVRVSAHNSAGYSYPTISSPTFLSPKLAPTPPQNATFFCSLFDKV